MTVAVPKLDLSNFNTPLLLEGIDAYIDMILTLILMEKGANPNSPDMGLYIERYRYSLITPETMEEIAEGLRTQLKTYIPTLPVYNVRVEQLDTHSIGIGMTILDTETDTTSDIILGATNTQQGVSLDVLLK